MHRAEHFSCFSAANKIGKNILATIPSAKSFCASDGAVFVATQSHTQAQQARESADFRCSISRSVFGLPARSAAGRIALDSAIFQGSKPVVTSPGRGFGPAAIVGAGTASQRIEQA